MKRLLLSFFSLLFTTLVFSQNADTATNYEWINNTWQNSTRDISYYNSSCLVDSILDQKWKESSSSWVNDLLITNSYNSSELITQSLLQNWNKNSNAWINITRTTFTYNANNSITEILTEKWNKNSSSWKDFARETRTYNNNNLLDSTTTQIWFGNDWQNNTLLLYAHKGDTTVYQRVRQTWNILLSSWDNQSRSTYMYNSSDQELTDTTQKWANNQWNNFQLDINTYDNGNLTNTLTQSWNETTSQWENSSQINKTYNDGVLSKSIAQMWDSGTSDWINQSKTIYSNSSGCLLPLSLLDFTATLNNKTAQLQWTTVTETNTKYFVVQRSTDGVHFTNIGTVNASGNSTQKITYQFSDGNVLNIGSNNVYYRLQMTDNDGKFTYSKIVRVTITPGGKLFVVYPNPVKDKLTIISSVSLNKTEVRITDITGKVVYKEQLENVQAEVKNYLNIASLNKGIYYLQLIAGSDAQTVKFVKY